MHPPARLLTDTSQNSTIGFPPPLNCPGLKFGVPAGLGTSGGRKKKFGFPPARLPSEIIVDGAPPGAVLRSPVQAARKSAATAGARRVRVRDECMRTPGGRSGTAVSDRV